MLSPRVPDLTALQLLLAVQTAGSLGAAGALLGITQQAASHRIRTMEAQVGVALLARSRRGSDLTPSGLLLAQWAAAVLDAATELDAGIAALRGHRDTHLRVSASLTIAEHLMPRWLLSLRSQQLGTDSTATDVALVTVNSAGVLQQIRDGAADVGFIESPDAPTGLPSRIVATDALVVVVAPGHSWVRRRTSVTMAQLARTPLVTREPGSGTREALATALARQAPGLTTVAPALEVSSTAAMRAAIISGAGPGALSTLTVADDIALGRLSAVPVLDLDLRRDLRAVWRSGAHPPAGPARDLIAIAARQQSRR